MLRGTVSRLLAAVLAVALSAATSAGDEAVRVQIDPALVPLSRWLEQDDPILRALAAWELRRDVRPGAIHLAMRVLERERDDIVLGCALGSLVGRPRVDLVAEGGPLLPGLLLRRMEHDHPVIRDRARQILRILPAEDPGPDTKAWHRWWLATHRALAEEQVRLLAARRASRSGTGSGPAAQEGRTTPAKETPDLYEHVARLRRDGLEVCIVLDHTGSMAPVISRARRRAALLVERLTWLVPRFRAGLVTYDDAARLRIALTSDGEALEKAVRSIVASGGGDWEEGVDKGIALALRQERLGWSRRAWRVLVVIGDAPPHAGDVAALLRRIQRTREDDLFDHPVIVNTVSTRAGGVDGFAAIAAAGGGIHVTLDAVGRLEEEIVTVSFGAAFRDRVEPWLREVEQLRRPDAKR